MKIFQRLIGLCIFILIWHLLLTLSYMITENPLLEIFKPASVYKATKILVSSSLFHASLIASLRRVCIGLFFAFIIGFPCGLLIGNFKIIRSITHLPIQILRMISPLSWMPLAVLFLPNFESAIYFLISVTCVWPIIINTSYGIKQIPLTWIQMAKNQGASHFQLITKIILPYVRPHYINGLRLSLGIAWIILVPAEFLGISEGLGYLINNYRDAMQYDSLLAVVLSIGFIGFILDGFIQFIQNKVSWKQ